MKKSFGLLFTIFRAFTLLVTFILAVILERPGSERLTYMVLIFAAFFSWIHLRELVIAKKYSKYIVYTFILDILLLLLLDDSSKFVVNYYFNIYYFFVLISAGFVLQKKQRLIISFLIICAAFVKYYRLIQTAFSDTKPLYNMNLPFVFSYLIFTLAVFVTIAVFFNYSRVLSEEKSKLDKLNNELKNANELLEQKNELIKELTIFEERNRIAREIHDSVGHNLTGLIMNLDFCEKLAVQAPVKANEQIASCKNIAKECLNEIRKSVQALKPQAVEMLPLIKSIEELVKGARQKFNLNVHIEVSGDIYKTKPEFNLVIYRTVQEALTNCVRHGGATKVNISIGFGEEKFTLFIKDNGTGTNKLKTGNGLMGMTERIKEFEGRIGFYTSQGFMINISVPTHKIV